MPANFSPMSEAGELSVTVYRQTCDMNTFRSGVADRGASIRIPLPVQLKGYGYLEDRRPAANVSPLPATDLLELPGCVGLSCARSCAVMLRQVCCRGGWLTVRCLMRRWTPTLWLAC